MSQLNEAQAGRPSTVDGAGRGLFVNRDVGPYEELFVDTGDDIIAVPDGVWLCGKPWYGVSTAWPLVAVHCMHEMPSWVEEPTTHHTFPKTNSPIQKTRN